MLTLFALVKDDADAITNDTLVRDLQHKLALAKEFEIKTETLVFPRVTALTGGHYLSVERRQRQIAHNIASLLFNAGQLGGESRFPPH